MRTEKTEKTWTCWGSVRGPCGEEHTTYGDAERHCARDGYACSRGANKGYSDRHPHLAKCSMGNYGVKCSCEPFSCPLHPREEGNTPSSTDALCCGAYEIALGCLGRL